MAAYNGHLSLIDTKMANYYFPTIESFSTYMNTQNNDECLEYKNIEKYNEATFQKVIRKKYDIDSINELSFIERRNLIKDIYNEFDISIRQLSKVLGVGKTVVENAIKEDR